MAAAECQAVVPMKPSSTSTLLRLGQLPVALLVEVAVVVWFVCRFAVVTVAYGSVGYVVSLVTVKSRRQNGDGAPSMDRHGCHAMPALPLPNASSTPQALPRPLSSTCTLPQSPLLLPQRPEHQGRLTVCLDLDETLICTYRRDQVPRWLQDLDCDDVRRRDVQVRSEDGSIMQDLVVFERAGLREFLWHLSHFAETVLFTAGLPSYAKPLCDELDPQGMYFVSRLYRKACVSSQGHCVKDLSFLGRDLRRVVLVDNNPYSFLRQPANGIPCLPFHGNPSDIQLLTVILPLVQSLALFPDVRPILQARFQMAKWLQGKGVEGVACEEDVEETRS